MRKYIVSPQERARLRSLVLEVTGDLEMPESTLDMLVTTMAIRNSYVYDMSHAEPFSETWNECSKKIFNCDAVLSQYRLV